MNDSKKIISNNENLISATLLGFIFGMISFLMTFTVVVPIGLLYLAIPIEYIASKVFEGSWFLIGISTSSVFTLIFLLTSYYFFKKLSSNRNSNPKKWKETLIFFFFSINLIIHPLFFYLSFAPTWSGLSDGQAIINLFKTFPVSSLSMILIGLIIDHYFQLQER